MQQTIQQRCSTHPLEHSGSRLGVTAANFSTQLNHRHQQCLKRSLSVGENFSTLLASFSVPQLKLVKFSRFLVEDGLQLLSQRCPNIFSLTLYQVQGRMCWDHIYRFNNLRELGIAYCSHVKDEHLRCMADMKTLQILVLASCKRLTGQTLKILAPISSLLKLSFTNFHWLNQREYDYEHSIPQIKSLQELYLDCTTVDDRFCESAQHLVALKTISLIWTDVTDAGLASLARIKSLRRINLSECTITDCGIRSISSLPLVRLSLRRCSITDDALALIGGMNSLYFLDISYCFCVTDAGVAELRRLTSLRCLMVAYCNITDQCVDSILEIPSLKELDISGTCLSDDRLYMLSDRLLLL